MDDAKEPLERLQGLLTEQVAAARQGDLRRVEDLARQTGRLVERHAARGLFRSPAYRQCKARVEGLYGDLTLILNTEKAEVADQLRHIRRGKKVLGTYRGASRGQR